MSKVEHDYDASTIKVLTPEDARSKFDWLMIDYLSKEYSVPVECVRRGFEVSFLLNISTDYYIDKYIRKLKVVENVDFTECYKDLMYNNKFEWGGVYNTP